MKVFSFDEITRVHNLLYENPFGDIPELSIDSEITSDNNGALEIESDILHLGALSPESHTIKIKFNNFSDSIRKVSAIRILDSNYPLLESINKDIVGEFKSFQIAPYSDGVFYLHLNLENTPAGFYILILHFTVQDCQPLKTQLYFSVDLDGMVLKHSEIKKYSVKVVKTSTSKLLDESQPSGNLLSFKISPNTRKLYCKSEYIDSNYIELKLNKKRDKKFLYAEGESLFSTEIQLDAGEDIFYFEDNFGRFINSYGSSMQFFTYDFTLSQKITDLTPDCIYRISNVKKGKTFVLSSPDWCIIEQDDTSKESVDIIINVLREKILFGTTNGILLLKIKGKEVSVRLKVEYLPEALELISENICIDVTEELSKPLPFLKIDLPVRLAGNGKTKITVTNSEIKHSGFIIDKNGPSIRSSEYPLEIKTSLFTSLLEEPKCFQLISSTSRGIHTIVGVSLNHNMSRINRSLPDVVGPVILHYGSRYQKEILFTGNNDEGISSIKVKLKELLINGTEIKSELIQEDLGIKSIYDQIIQYTELEPGKIVFTFEGRNIKLAGDFKVHLQFKIVTKYSTYYESLIVFGRFVIGEAEFIYNRSKKSDMNNYTSSEIKCTNKKKDPIVIYNLISSDPFVIVDFMNTGSRFPCYIKEDEAVSWVVFENKSLSNSKEKYISIYYNNSTPCKINI
ncbi:MAG: hypothetical protein NTX65_14860 [Ignavibacteriales bacterium]|nr:hypothetical protein [Ignavibacteriales bacterium]